MNDHQFDRIARLLSRAASRRHALAALGTLALARTTPASAASQIETAACGEAGAVCTALKGCCSGLVCVTSTINPAYGACVAGEGDMLPVSDDLVVPGAEGVEEELALEVSGASADAAEAESILAAQEAEIQARRAARRSTNNTQQARRRLNQDNQQSRKATNRSTRRTTKDANRAARELNDRPRLLVKLSDNDNNPVTDDAEILTVRNREDVPVVVSRIESLKEPGVYYNQTVTIAAGDKHLFLSGDKVDSSKNKSGSTVWAPNEEICPVAPNGEGIRLTVAKQFATQKHRFKKRC